MSSPIPYMPDFKPIIQTYVLHNATPEQIILMWGGLQMTIPPVDEVGPRSAFDENREPIPGTRVIQDTYTAAPDGSVPQKGDPPNWFAAHAIKNILQIDAITGEAIGPSARKGVSVLPAAPTATMIASAKDEGNARYQQFLVDWATDCVNGYQVARERNQQAGYAPPPPGSDYQRAVIILEHAHQEMKKTMGMAEDLAGEVSPELNAKVEEEALKLATGLAEKKKMDVDPVELAAKLLENPEIRQSLRRRGLRIRKVGHMPDPEPKPEVEPPPEPEKVA